MYLRTQKKRVDRIVAMRTHAAATDVISESTRVTQCQTGAGFASKVGADSFADATSLANVGRP